MSKVAKDIVAITDAIKSTDKSMSVSHLVESTGLNEGRVRRALAKAVENKVLYVATRSRVSGASFANFYSTEPVKTIELMGYTPRANPVARQPRTTFQVINRAKELGGHFGVLVAQLGG